MKLYEIPRDSKILLPLTGPNFEGEAICDFKHIDGMYSLIYTPDGHPVHLGASTEVKLVGDHYELGSEDEQG